MMRHVFISHASADRIVIEQDILPLLRAHGIRYWYASENIPSASDWEKEIRQSLMACDWFLVALSATAIRSDWVQAEVHWALDHRKDRFVSLLLASCTPSDLHLKLIRYQHVDFREPNDDSNRRLVEAFGVPFQYIPRIRIDYQIGDIGQEPTSLIINETAIIGRATDCAIVIRNGTVSRRHAMLKVRTHEDGATSIWLSDLGSAGGVWLNGTRVREPIQIHPGDCLGMGSAEIHLLAISQTGQNC